MKKEKMIIYQVLPRLFANTNQTRIPRGSLKQNGCGKFNDFTDQVLQAIQSLGVNYIWYTGVLEHATQTDFSAHGIPMQHPAVVKGKAGSPYAITDYYDVAPSLATNIDQRMAEFEQLVQRTHKQGMKVLIDFVPNHVAREYYSDQQPEGTQSLGETDNRSCSFSPQNNFYYLVDQKFNPTFSLEAAGFASYTEFPAKVTGNNQFTSSPTQNDWYETVKLNYGIDYAGGGTTYFTPIPNTWIKMRDILLFWAKKGVDGFRCDMIEMVPVEFWKWLIPLLKEQYPQLIFIGEAYNAAQYNNYLYQGQFDYLYDKVGLYDTLKAIIQGNKAAAELTHCWQSLGSMQPRMLHFLENHDEQRIASDFFAGDPFHALPALVVASCMGTNPFMLYAGQEFGEKGMDQEGFSGLDGRTSIFDYWSLDTLSRWNNKGKYNFEQLSTQEVKLYQYYKLILNIAAKEEAIIQGLFFDLMYVNPPSPSFNPNKHYVFLRSYEAEVLLVCVNFDSQASKLSIHIPQHAFDYLKLPPSNRLVAADLLTANQEVISFSPDRPTSVEIPEYGSKILKFHLK